jgi:hypothetical protein
MPEASTRPCCASMLNTKSEIAVPRWDLALS